jgi:hypothetical protein
VLGYSEGSFRANDNTFTSGGQCEDGLKIVFVIGELKASTTEGKLNKNHGLIRSVLIKAYNITAISIDSLFHTFLFSIHVLMHNRSQDYRQFVVVIILWCYFATMHNKF